MKESEFAFDDWRTVAFWIFMVVAGLIAGFVLGWCWRDRTGTLANVSLLSVMTAIGTVGAVIVALWASFSEARKRAAERRKYQSVYRWLFMSEAMVAQANLEELDCLLKKYISAKAGVEMTVDAKEHCSRVIAKLQAPALEKYIDSLVFFKDDTAQALASLAANLPGLKVNSEHLFESWVVEPKRQAFACVMSSRVDLVLTACSKIDWEIDSDTIK